MKTCVRVTVLCLLCVFWSMCCHADSLIITYQSGKTQTVTLADFITSITSLQYLSSEATRKNNAGDVEIKTPQDVTSPAMPGTKPDVKESPAPKGNIKFKWADPLGGE